MAVGGVNNNNRIGGGVRDRDSLTANDPMKAMEKLMKDIMGLLQQQRQAQGAQGGQQGGGGPQQAGGGQQAGGAQQAGGSQGSSFGPDELAQELEKQLKKLKEMAAQNPAALAQLLQANPAMAGLLQQGLTPSAGSGVSMGTPAISGGGLGGGR